MSKSTTNEFCLECHRAHNGINGRWCKQMGSYVEGSEIPPCMNEEKTEQESKER